MAKIKDTECISPADFAKRGEGIVNFGRAPDGIPWVTCVSPPPSGADLLQSAHEAFCLRDALPDFAGTPLHGIASELDELIRKQYSQRIELPSGKAFRGTILPRPLRSLIGDTLLERLFASMSPPGVRTRTWPRVRTRNLPHTGAQVRRLSEAAVEIEDEPAVFSFQQGDACIAFPDDEQAVSVVYMTHDAGGWPSFEYRRPFMQESLSAFADGTSCLQSDEKIFFEAPIENGAEYLEKRKSYQDGSWLFSISRSSLGAKLLELVLATNLLQTAGEIHGDIKPGNILVTTDGLQLIDSLRLEAGGRSPALTPGWAAPEQIMAAEVAATTDQFPIGLMLLALVRGVLFGEETTIVVPSGGSETQRHTIFRSPMVFVDPDSGTVVPEHIWAWTKLIERCLRFSPEERFPTAADLAGELEHILNLDSFRGTCEFPIHFGHEATMEAKDGENAPCWIV